MDALTHHSTLNGLSSPSVPALLQLPHESLAEAQHTSSRRSNFITEPKDFSGALRKQEQRTSITTQGL